MIVTGQLLAQRPWMAHQQAAESWQRLVNSPILIMEMTWRTPINLILKQSCTM